MKYIYVPDPSLSPCYRFGVYTLTTVYGGYPAFSRAVSGQHLFFQQDLGKWQYAHRISRWIVGPNIGDSSVRLACLKSTRSS